jgi:hypothetical protein
MRVAALALALLIAACAAATLGAPASAGGAADMPLLRLRDGHGSDLLFRVDPRTLRPLSRPIRTFRNGYSLAFSPDGRFLAYTDGSRARSRIQFVDLARWRSLGVARLGRHGPLGIGWVSPGRVVAIMGQGFGRQRLVWVDVPTRKVVARRALSGRLVTVFAVPGGFALAMGPHRGVGPLRLVVAGADGATRTLRLDGIEAGGNEDAARPRYLRPGIAVDQEHSRVYVIAARGLTVAEVELASGAVSYHSLGASAAKGNIDVWWREAAWAGDGRIAVSGEHFRPGRGRRPPDGPVPLGVRLIDTRDWTISTLDPRPTITYVSGDTVLAYGTRWFSGKRPPESTGLLAFDRTGERSFVRFRGQDIATLGGHGRLLYAWVRRTRTLHVIDVRDGHSVNAIHTGRRIPFLLTPQL